MFLDGNEINLLSDFPTSNYGTLSFSQLAPDVYHTVSVYCLNQNYGAYVALALIYRES